MNLCIWSIISVTLLVALIPYLKLSTTKGEIKPKKASFKPDTKLLFLICCVCELVANSVTLFCSSCLPLQADNAKQSKARTSRLWSCKYLAKSNFLCWSLWACQIMLSMRTMVIMCENLLVMQFFQLVGITLLSSLKWCLRDNSEG